MSWLRRTSLIIFATFVKRWELIIGAATAVISTCVTHVMRVYRRFRTKLLQRSQCVSKDTRVLPRTRCQTTSVIYVTRGAPLTDVPKIAIMIFVQLVTTN